MVSKDNPIIEKNGVFKCVKSKSKSKFPKSILSAISYDDEILLKSSRGSKRGSIYSRYKKLNNPPYCKQIPFETEYSDNVGMDLDRSVVRPDSSSAQYGGQTIAIDNVKDFIDYRFQCNKLNGKPRTQCKRNKDKVTRFIKGSSQGSKLK